MSRRIVIALVALGLAACGPAIREDQFPARLAALMDKYEARDPDFVRSAATISELEPDKYAGPKDPARYMFVKTVSDIGRDLAKMRSILNAPDSELTNDYIAGIFGHSIQFNHAVLSRNAVEDRARAFEWARKSDSEAESDFHKAASRYKMIAERDLSLIEARIDHLKGDGYCAKLISQGEAQAKAELHAYERKSATWDQLDDDDRAYYSGGDVVVAACIKAALAGQSSVGNVSKSELAVLCQQGL